ncbi:glycosyltransferase [Vibrio breoganii]
MNRPKNILFYIPSLHYGGVESVITAYVKEMSKRHNIVLLVDDQYEVEPYRLNNQSIRTIYVKQGISSKISIKAKTSKLVGTKLFWTFFRYVVESMIFKFKVKNLVNIEKFDVIIYAYHYLPIELIKKSPNKANKIMFVQNSYETLFTGIRKYYRNRFRENIRLFDTVLFVNEVSEMHFKQSGLLRASDFSRTIENPIEKDRVIELSNLIDKPIDISKEFIVSVGRLNESNKDFTTLIKAFIRTAKYHDLDLVIIGDGPSRKHLTNLALSSPYKERIHFTGFIENPFPIVKQAKAFVLSSRSESFGMVLLEAMSLNVPVIASDCPVGPRLILEDGMFGTLFNTGDIYILSEILKDISIDDSYRKMLHKAEKAFNNVDKYSLQSQVHKLEELL